MDQVLKPIELAITGMSCASCVNRLERVLRRVPGVASVSVNLATESAHIEGSGAVAALISAVQGAGYGAALRGAAKPFDDRRERWELAAGAALCVPLLLGMVLGLPGWAGFALATPVQFWLGARFYTGAYKALRGGAASMDVLVALGTSAAYGLSVVDLFTHGPLYFESAAVVITLVRLGKFFEERARHEAVRAMTGLAALRPAVARLANGREVTLAALRVGDEIVMRPGERVPVDGVIAAGAGSLDESLITGEALPVARQAGQEVLAGTMNLDGALTVRVTAKAGETLLDRMARLIEAAQGSKPAVQRLADQVAAVFVPVVLVIAAVTLGGWLLVHAPVGKAVLNAVSVLVIACPCALGLATPAAILAGTGAGAKHGILIRDAGALQAAAQVGLVMFDKTGTLTLGTPRLETVLPLGDMPEATVRQVAAALAAADTHPLSAALRAPGVAAAQRFKALPGRGVEGVVDHVLYRLGSAALVAGAVPVRDMPAGATLSYLLREDGAPVAAFAFTDTIKPGAAAAVRRLKAMGLRVAMLSGDRHEAAAAVATALGIATVYAPASPAEKLAAIHAAQAAGAVVAMVGDGVNDAAALAAAHVGMAMGSGADVAIESAGISLLRPDVMLVADALDLARKTWAILRQGLFWAVVYNAVGIPLAAFGVLSPMVAGAAMAASSVCVLGNALRLRRWRPGT